MLRFQETDRMVLRANSEALPWAPVPEGPAKKQQKRSRFLAIYGDFTVNYSDFMVIYSDFMVIYSDFMVIYSDLMVIYSDFYYFGGI